jgi:GT2 family glycosyltransferase
MTWPVDSLSDNTIHESPAVSAGIHAAASADSVAFVDDEEVPDPRWLQELLIVQSRYGANVVCGPVLPVFSS